VISGDPGALLAVRHPAPPGLLLALFPTLLALFPPDLAAHLSLLPAEPSLLAAAFTPFLSQRFHFSA